MRLVTCLAVAGLLGVSACQGGGSQLVATVAGGAQIRGSVVNIRQTDDGSTVRYEYDVVFESLNGIGAHFTARRACHVVDGSCRRGEADFTVPAGGRVVLRGGFASDYNLDVDGHTVYYTGVDTNGNPAETHFTFSTDMAP